MSCLPSEHCHSQGNLKLAHNKTPFCYFPKQCHKTIYGSSKNLIRRGDGVKLCYNYHVNAEHRQTLACFLCHCWRADGSKRGVQLELESWTVKHTNVKLCDKVGYPFGDEFDTDILWISAVMSLLATKRRTHHKHTRSQGLHSLSRLSYYTIPLPFWWRFK